MASEMYPDPSVEDLGTYGADNVSIIYGLEFKTSQHAAQAEHLPDPPYVENVSPLQATTRSGRQIRSSIIDTQLTQSVFLVFFGLKTKQLIPKT